jgi:hypothetical protein
LLDNDRRTEWERRMERLELAELIAHAMHGPENLRAERERIESMAAGHVALRGDDLRARGERMARFIRKGHVLDDEVLVS